MSNIKKLINRHGLDIVINDIKSKYELRFECDRFLILVNKENGSYINVYNTDFENQKTLKIISSVLNKHKNML